MAPFDDDYPQSDGLTWPERIAHYRQTLDRSAYMTFEDGWAYGVWFLGNSWAVKSGYYGGYPQGYLKRLRALFPDKRRVLHLFSGMVDVTQFPGDTCDVNPERKPTYVADAHTLEGVPVEEYDLILADPPYSADTGPRTTSICRAAISSIRSRRPTPSGSVSCTPSSWIPIPRTARSVRLADPRIPMFTSSVP